MDPMFNKLYENLTNIFPSSTKSMSDLPPVRESVRLTKKFSVECILTESGVGSFFILDDAGKRLNKQMFEATQAKDIAEKMDALQQYAISVIEGKVNVGDKEPGKAEKELIEKIKLRPFTDTDWHGLSGAEQPSDEQEPLIGDFDTEGDGSEFAIVVVDKNGVGLLDAEGKIEYFKEMSFSEGTTFAEALPASLTVAKAKELGFKVVLGESAKPRRSIVESVGEYRLTSVEHLGGAGSEGLLVRVEKGTDAWAGALELVVDESAAPADESKVNEDAGDIEVTVASGTKVVKVTDNGNKVKVEQKDTDDDKKEDADKPVAQPDAPVDVPAQPAGDQPVEAKVQEAAEEKVEGALGDATGEAPAVPVEGDAETKAVEKQTVADEKAQAKDLEAANKEVRDEVASEGKVKVEDKDPAAAEKELIEADSYKVIAAGLTDKAVADRIAQEKHGRVIQDEQDAKKFMVVVGEKK